MPELNWNDEANKDTLANTTSLFHLKTGTPTCIMTNASDVAMGAV